MADFQNPPLVRDVNDARHLHAATPRTLKISVSDARQVAPALSTAGNTLLLFSGLIRFGWDGDSKGQDTSNEAGEYAEADGDGTPRTVMLLLHGPQNSDRTPLADSQFIGSGTFAALGDVYLTTNDDSFEATADNGATALIQPMENGNQLDRDLWLLSDINTQRATGDSSLINRMSYQAAVLAALK
jgi:hypothetical protein